MEWREGQRGQRKKRTGEAAESCRQEERRETTREGRRDLGRVAEGSRELLGGGSVSSPGPRLTD